MSNVISFTGHCAKDAEVRYLQSGQAVLTVSVGNNVGFGDKQKTNWFRVSVWGRRAEGELKNYLLKGAAVFVSGELSQHEYEKDGQTKVSLEVNATIIDLIGGRKESSPAPQSQHHNNFDDYDDGIVF